MNTSWDKVDHGRYALRHGNDVLQVMYSPDAGSDDKRPYIAIVDKKPLARRYWTLREAKTGAMDAAGVNGHARQTKETTMSRAMQNAAAVKAHTHSNGQPSATELLDRAFDDLLPKHHAAPKAQPKEPEPSPVEPEPEPEPMPSHEPPPDIPPPDPTDHAEPEPVAAVSRVAIDLPRDLAAPDAAGMLVTAQTSINSLQEIMTLLTQAQAAVQLLCELGIPCRLELPQGIKL